jgi:glycerol-3-phosphate dehydrogenase (NAD(P)+)
MMRVAVLGAGSWGTTLANLLARKGEEVRIWAYESEVVDAINSRHENPLYLPDCTLAPRLTAAADARDVVRGASVILSAAPSHAVRAVLGRVAGCVEAGTLVVSATKGLEVDTLASMSTVIAEVLPDTQVAVL